MKLKAKETLEIFYENKFFIAIHSASDSLDFINTIYHYMALEFSQISEAVFVEKYSPSLSSSLFDQPNQTAEFIEFYAYLCTNPMDQCTYTLYENLKNAHPLIKSLPSVDYIWMLEDINDPEKYSMDMISKINKLPSVQISRILDTKEIKEKNRLIL